MHRRRGLPEPQGTPARTEPAVTAVDRVDRAHHADDVVGILTETVRAGVDPERILEAVAARSRMRHRRLVLDVLAAAVAGVESPLEYRYHRDVERAHGLPTSRLQVREVVGGRWIRADVVYEEYSMRSELDGELGHPGGRTDSDTWRDNDVVLDRGQVTLRYRWGHVAGRSCAVAGQVGRGLRTGGWAGSPRRCGPPCRLEA
ncbi:hypothetical protein Bcav_0639 [Beutenbergia cavernae DSM 12333]|uniref:Uncharacterized protein n=1 Tax=Beutenbergia cavernae (strain ATCC BAA-8 / DSM 12333 / CCUG 43141 / JCM 11478 / NBRC 16432 / NCIMB 13614 / HKI 0122) TaxID=471853 RepID=C5BY07_BEUC1|nr:hypothetical protein Bcav_0639 [Beutenbergia cavernae DSM 12333]